MKFSVVIPSYNQGPFLEETLQSLFQQKADLECLVIDGGSTDNSVEIIRKYANRLAWWVSEKDKGQSDAINKGIQKATGDFIGWLNSDDVMLAGWLTHLQAFLESVPNPESVGIVTGGVPEFRKQFDFTAPVEPSGTFRTIETASFYQDFPVLQPGSFFSLKALKQVGPVDSGFHRSMDYELYSRIALAGYRVYSYDKPVAGFRLHDESKTSAGRFRFAVDNLAMAFKLDFPHPFKVRHLHSLFHQLACENKALSLKECRSKALETFASCFPQYAAALEALKPHFRQTSSNAYHEACALRMTAAFRSRDASCLQLYAKLLFKHPRSLLKNRRWAIPFRFLSPQ